MASFAMRAGACAPAVAAPRPQRGAMVVCASYRNKENIDLTRVPAFQRSPADTGSPEAQIARLSARVQQMSRHLIANRKDHGSKRGLERALAARRSLMQYLYSKDRATYDRLCVELGIRNVVKGHVVQQPGAPAAH